MVQQIKVSLIAHADDTRLPLQCMKNFVGDGMVSEVVEYSNDAEPRYGNATQTRNLPDDDEVVRLQARSSATKPPPAERSEESMSRTIQVDSVVGPIVQANQSKQSLYPNLPDASALLVMKACGALSTMGYDAASILKVGKLITANTITAVYYGGLPVDDDVDLGFEAWMAQRTEYILSVLLANDQERSRSVNINSNEPVVLINSFGDLSEKEIEDLANITNHKLQQLWNVWPVRVYAGSYFELPENSPFRDFGFSISLLNVVNAEIGGPSMIQLFDFDDHKGWLGTLRKDGRHHRGEFKMFIGRSNTSPVEKPSTVVEQQTYEESSSDASHAGSFSEDSHQENAVPDSVPTQPVVRAQAAPAYPEQTQEEAHEDSRATFDQRVGDSGPPIEYPTWKHASHDESLLDLIRRQASTADGSDEKEDTEKSESEASSGKVNETRSEEGFVVV